MEWTRLYKLTTDTLQTYGGYKWVPGKIHNAPGEGPLCSAGWLHAYLHPGVAAMLNVGDAAIAQARCWEADGVVGETDHGLQVGCTALRLLGEVPMPVLTTTQRVRMAISCALAAYHEPTWDAWATSWLMGTHRSRDSQQTESARLYDLSRRHQPPQGSGFDGWAAWWAVESAGPTVFAAEDAAMAVRMAAYRRPLDLGMFADAVMGPKPVTLMPSIFLGHHASVDAAGDER